MTIKKTIQWLIIPFSLLALVTTTPGQSLPTANPVKPTAAKLSAAGPRKSVSRGPATSGRARSHKRAGQAPGQERPTPPRLDSVRTQAPIDTTTAGEVATAVSVPAPATPAPPPPRYAPEATIPASQIIKSYYVELPFNKTVSVLFSSPIRSVDLGSRDIIADRAVDVANVLKVKATRIGFNETNFSVITADGKFYSFVANYNETPQILALNLSNTEQMTLPPTTARIGTGNEEGLIQFAGVNATQSEIVTNCNRIMAKRRTVRHLGEEANKMLVQVRGMYVKDNVFYYKISFRNKSNIHYEVDYVRFFVVDKTVAKRTSSQETEVQPLYVFNESIRTVRGRTTIEKIFAFPRFTIPDNKRLLIQAGEVNGGRTLSFVINNDDIVNADTL